MVDTILDAYAISFKMGRPAGYPAAYAGAAERRTADGVGPCSIEHAIENSGADHSFGAPCGIAAGAPPLADERLVATHRCLDQRAFAVPGDLLPTEPTQRRDRQQVEPPRDSWRPFGLSQADT